MSELDQLLLQINESLSNTSEALEKLHKLSAITEPTSEAVRQVLSQAGGTLEIDKISLLTLKNGSMLAYIDSLIFIIYERLMNLNATSFDQARSRSVEHRVCLEKGVRPLENKLSYQIDKLIMSYNKMETEYKQAQERANQKSGTQSQLDDDEVEEDEELLYRPNVLGMNTKPGSLGAENFDSGYSKGDSDGDPAKLAIYKPPKINTLFPPQQKHSEDKFNAQDHRDKSSRSRMQAMEEYIGENYEQPKWEASIGTNIVNHGKGGVKSLRDTESERRIQQYEENNFTRLNSVGNKVEKRKAKQRERAAKINMIGGEDFSIFNSKRQLKDSTSRRSHKKSRCIWDKAKNNM